MHCRKGIAAVERIVRIVGVSVSSNTVSGRSTFGRIAAPTAISANREAARNRDDIFETPIDEDAMIGARDWQLNRDPLATICAANRAIGAPFGEDAHLR